MHVMNVGGEKFEMIGDSEKMVNNICSSCLTLGIACVRSKAHQKRGPKPGAIRTSASQSVHVLVANILKGTSSEPFLIPEDKESIRKILIKLANRIKELEKDRELGDYDNWILSLRHGEENLDSKLSHSNSNPPHSRLGSQSASEQSPSSILHGSGVCRSPSLPCEFEASSSFTKSPELEPTDNENDNVDDLSKVLAHFSFGTLKGTHFGESSNIMLMKVAMEHKKELAGSDLPDWTSIFASVRRPEFWDPEPWPSWYPISRPELQPPLPPYEFPSQDVLSQLLNVYFIQWEPYSPLLHRPSFEKSISEGLHRRDPAFGAIVLAVCALGTRLLSGSRTDANEGERWASQVRMDQFVFNQTLELEHLQLYCFVFIADFFLAGSAYKLMLFYMHSMPKGVDSAWLIAGMAIRRAQEKGAHRRYTISSKQPTVQGELWKRAFWTLIVVDIRMSTLFGRPRATSIQDFDVEPLIECDDEYWDPEDGSPPFVQPPGKPCRISYFNAYLKLMEIYGFAQLTIYSVRKSELGNKMGIGSIEWYEKAVMGIDSALNQWMGLIPEHLQWDQEHQDPIFFTQSTLLYSWYYWVQIGVHRRFIPRPKDGSGILSFPSLAICTNAARSCLRVCERCMKRSMRYHPQLMIVLFNSATVLALNLIRSIRLNIKFDVRKEMMDIHKCMDLLRLYEPKYLLAGRFVDVLNVMMFASHLPPPVGTLGSPAVPTENNSMTQGPTIPNHPNQLPSNQVSAISGAWANVPQNPRFTENNHPPSPTQLPFYSSELGELPIHNSSQSSFNGPPGTGQFGQNPSNSNSNYLEALNFDSLTSSSSPYPDVQYFSLFDDTMGNANGSFSVMSPSNPGTLQNSTSANQDWDSFMAGVGQLLNTANNSSADANFDQFNF
ncbi:hypothetical protein D9758_013649 [Tetrapyrgos nigripes]|uniref:Xylanolytic transcriptional activator regulatory domain-containing protein n=1 Tax=Tetrapyrgos nigripes TaxID=182062 RepID=A0A8H5CPC3_9AGAR|nr:hypothetical protein D9758_013649 [Tetrapyrgos nigripes]